MTGMTKKGAPARDDRGEHRLGLAKGAARDDKGGHWLRMTEREYRLGMTEGEVPARDGMGRSERPGFPFWGG